MLDPTAIPFLMKAVDFLFGEGSKILEERRERRKVEVQGNETIEKLNQAEAKSLTISTKEIALQQPLDEFVLKQYEERVKHLLSLLDIYARNYQLAKSQEAKWGSALVPQVITHNLIEAGDNIERYTKELRDILAKIYGKSFVLPIDM